MLGAVLGLFSRDLAVDLGTSTTRIHSRGCGVVRREPTVAAIRTNRRGERSLFAIGEPARQLIGRAPSDLHAVRPLRAGAIHDQDVTEAFLLHILRELHGRNRFIAPRLVFATPAQMAPTQRHALRASCAVAGARSVHTIARPVAAALGAGLALRPDDMHLIVDVGSGTTDIAVLHGRRVLCSQQLTGGDALDHQLALHLREHHALDVSDDEAERLKCAALGSDRAPTIVRARGRCTHTGLPALRSVATTELEALARPTLQAIGQRTAALLGALAPKEAARVRGTGALLTGAACRLRGLDEAIAESTHLLVFTADSPEDVVIRGAGMALDANDEIALQPC